MSYTCRRPTVLLMVAAVILSILSCQPVIGNSGSWQIDPESSCKVWTVEAQPGESAEEATVVRIRRGVEEALASRPFHLLEIAVTKMGRAVFAVALHEPRTALPIEELHAMRELLRHNTQRAHDPLRMEIIFTGEKPYV